MTLIKAYSAHSSLALGPQQDRGLCSMLLVAGAYLQSIGAQVMLMILASISPAATWAVDLMRPGQLPSVTRIISNQPRHAVVRSSPGY